MRKLNKIIKQHTTNKMSRKKKNTEVAEYLEYVLSYMKNKEKYNLIRKQFETLQKVVFLERYFLKEMTEANVNISDILFDYFDFDLYAVEEKTIREMHAYLTNPDEETRNRVKLVSVRIPVIGQILREYDNL